MSRASDLPDEAARRERELESLRQRDRTLSDFIENASIGFHSVGPDGIILWANRAELDLLGYSEKEYVGHHIAEFHLDKPAIDDILQRLAAGEALHDYEARLRCKDASIRRVLISSNALMEGDRLVHTRCQTRDITESRRYEQSLLAQYSVARILSQKASIAEAAPGLVQNICQALELQAGLFWTLQSGDEELRCTSLWQQPSERNDEFERICRGRTFRIGVGLPGRIWESRKLAWITDIRKDKNFPRLSAAAERGLLSAFGFPVFLGGEVFGVMEFFSDQLRPPDKDLLQMAATIGFQTGEFLERQRAQKSLADREESYRVLTETASDGIVTINASSTILFANSATARIFGYTHQELVGADLTMLMPDHLRQVHKAAIARYQQTGKRHIPWQAVQLPGRHKDGREIPLELSFAEYQQDHKHVFVGIIRDITERKRLDEKLLQAAKLESLGLLAGGIAHDFNNLLTGIVGNVSLALETLPETHMGRPPLRDAEEAGERAAHLTKQLLAYAGKGRFVIQPLDLSHLVGEISALVKTSIPKTVQLRLALADKLPCIEGDATQLQQLIMNLVINGAEAIGPDKDGTVLITTGVQDVDRDYIEQTLANKGITPGKYVFVEVHDTGSGMDEATLAHIFDPFFTTKFTGRGLGLAAAMGIVRGHKGALKVYSTPGRGSTFKVLLPVTDIPAPPAQPVRSQGDFKGLGTVLVVDDEEVVRKVARSILERYGYTVLVAENGLQALEIFEQMGNRIALVLLDLTMPVMDGEEALRRLKAINPNARILLSSGFNEMEAIQRFAGKGLAGFVQKPYTSARLAEKLREALGKN